MRVLLVLLTALSVSQGFQNFLSSSFVKPSKKNAAQQLENELINAIDTAGNRLGADNRIDSIVAQLETMPSIPEPAIADEIYGRWKLLLTTNAETSSPIQRKAVDAQKFQIYQDIIVNDNNVLQVNQVVVFAQNFTLSVDALASTSAYPLPELTARKGDGRILGLNLLGVSKTGQEATPDESRPNSRIDFVFDEGKFLGPGFSIPYPVPFRLPLLRDAVKGWIDITYLSDRIRIARGNKGTTFILRKELTE